MADNNAKPVLVLGDARIFRPSGWSRVELPGCFVQYPNGEFDDPMHALIAHLCVCFSGTIAAIKDLQTIAASLVPREDKFVERTAEVEAAVRQIYTILDARAANAERAKAIEDAGVDPASA